MLHVSYILQELIRENPDIRLVQPRRAEDVDDLIRYQRPADDLPKGVFLGFICELCVLGSVLCEGRPDCLEERQLVPVGQGIIQGAT